VLFGPAAWARNHLAIALTMAMIEQVNPAAFFRPPSGAARCRKARQLRLRRASEGTRYALLVMIDISYRAPQRAGNSVLFALNLPPLRTPLRAGDLQQPFREWDTIFPSGLHGRGSVDGCAPLPHGASKARLPVRKKLLQGF